MEITLAEKIKKNFSVIKTKGTAVKVPRLRIKKIKTIKSKPKKQNDKIPNSSLINILIKTAVENAKRELKEKPVENGKSYKLLKGGKKLISHGGYGSVSKRYGSVHTSYIDYGKLFSYLGKFRTKSPYESIASTREQNPAEAKAFTLVDTETMDKGARYVRYFFPKAADFHSTLTSLVPVAGMNSAEWEQFKLWMKLEPVMYMLKTSTS